MPVLSAETITTVIALARHAGKRIVELRSEGLNPERKADRSPVTEADKEADRLIHLGLRLLDDTPVISEESGFLPPAESLPERFWMVDPLDGTRGFIRGEPYFTVNIALIEHGTPVFGVIDAPALGVCFAGAKGLGAWQEIEDARIPLPLAHRHAALISSFHAKKEADILHALLSHLPQRALSSSYKFCEVAAGEASLYFRLGPTSEWDTAAGQAIVEAAGGVVRAFPSGEPLRYGKPSYLNPGFVAGHEEQVLTLLTHAGC